MPWQFVAEEALQKDISAAGILSYVLNPTVGILILAGAAIALLNDLPAMILSVSRLVFSWAEDGIFPNKLSLIHSQYQTPYAALILSGIMASIGVLGSHFAGDFFLGIDIMVTSMLINFLLMSCSLFFLPFRNPTLAGEIKTIKNRNVQRILAILGMLFLATFLIIHISKDLNAQVSDWYFHSTWVYLLVLLIASLLFSYQWTQLKKSGVDVAKRFSELPD